MNVALTWEKQPLTQQLARSLRAGTRRHPQIDGHAFGFSDLKELWCADDVHAVCTHAHDPAWMYLYQAPEGGWRLVSVHTSRAAAQKAASANTDTDPEAPVAGTYVMGRLDGGRWMRVQVLSKAGEAMLTEIFSRLGCQTKLEHVEEAA